MLKPLRALKRSKTHLTRGIGAFVDTGKAANASLLAGPIHSLTAASIIRDSELLGDHLVDLGGGAILDGSRDELGNHVEC
jgi:hypothetical protein